MFRPNVCRRIIEILLDDLCSLKQGMLNTSMLLMKEQIQGLYECRGGPPRSNSEYVL